MTHRVLDIGFLHPTKGYTPAPRAGNTPVVIETPASLELLIEAELLAAID